MAKLSLRHVYKIYDNCTKAVNDFNLEIGDNEFVVFVGPSGCGKSTTLRMIAGLEDITAGDFYIDGILANQLEPKDRDIAMVFQNYALYPHMTVYENMAFGLRIRHVPKDEIDSRVKEAAKILDISDQLDKKPKEMSGGQRQRVALGRAIVRKPKVFLLDEPLSNLDAKLRSSMRNEITRLHKVLGTTFIYVTHDQIEAMTMGSKIVVMKKGVIQQVDSPMNLYDYPQNVFVAGFIGTPQMNFISGKVSYAKNGLVRLSMPCGDILLNHDDLSKLSKKDILENKDVVIGIRPEHVKLGKKGDENTYAYRINSFELLGNESNLFVESLDGGVSLVVKTLRDDSLNAGDVIYLSFDVSKIHIFDKNSELTLMKRLQDNSFVTAKIGKNKLTIFDKDFSLSDEMYGALKGHKEVYVNIPSSAVKAGKGVELEIAKKEKINGKWQFLSKFEGEYLYFTNDEYLEGDKVEISIDTAKLDFYDKDLNIILNAIKDENVISGKLIPCVRKLPVLKGELVQGETLSRIKEKNYLDDAGKKINIKYKKKKVFRYSLLNKEIEPSDDAVIKIYSLLGKKFDLHTIKFVLSCQDIKIVDDGGFKAKVEKISDYADKTYLEVSVGGEKLLLLSDGSKYSVGDEVSIAIDEAKIGVYDENFGVKLI